MKFTDWLSHLIIIAVLWVAVWLLFVPPLRWVLMGSVIAASIAIEVRHWIVRRRRT